MLEKSFHLYLNKRELHGRRVPQPVLPLPSKVTKSLRLSSRPYCLKFAPNGDFYYTATQDHSIAFRRPSNHDLFWKLSATVGQWTVTDYNLSPCGNWMAYTSLVPFVHVAKMPEFAAGGSGLQNLELQQTVLNFSEGCEDAFGLYCIRFSSDSLTLLSGGTDSCLYLYDLTTSRLITRIQSHRDDVNSVTFIQPNVLLSGSDDCSIKVWDQRSLKNNNPSGILVGHTEGVTCVDVKGMNVISNGKDQTLKLWDLRTMTHKEDDIADIRIDIPMWDYRWQQYPLESPRMHSKDGSIHTFTGHQVLKTLIRCYFGPPHAPSLIYTGSSDGVIRIFNILTLKEEEKIDCGNGLVRDLTWHPYDNLLYAGQWGNNRERGRILVCEADTV